MFYKGEILDQTFRIEKEIGTGGTGIIYLAYHLRLQKYVVVKKIKDHFVNQVDVRIEVDTLKSLHHMYLPQVYDFLQINQEIYTIMDFIEGHDLQYYLDMNYKFNEKQLMIWLSQLSEVLEYLHSQKPPILHCDIKPANIMITQEENVCLIDFNISLDGNHTKNIWGLSQWYASPEQYEKARRYMARHSYGDILLDGRMDIYSLGATFYRLMTGRMPSVNRRDMISIMQIELPYSYGLLAIVAKAMEWDRRKRYADAAALRRALERVYRWDKYYKKLQRIHTGLSAFCAACVLLGIWSIVYGGQSMCFEQYKTDFGRLERACEEYDNEKIMSAGIDMLNNKKYQKILDQRPKEKASLFYVIGDVCFEEKKYVTAMQYYSDARKENPENAIYYRDEAIAAARSGDEPRAEEVLREASLSGIANNSIELAKQEMAFEKKEIEEVFAIAGRLIENGDPDTVSRSCLLAARACSLNGDTLLQKEYLEQAYQTNADRRCLRELGLTYLELVKKKEGETYYQEYLNKSEECFKILEILPIVKCEDSVTLAVIWMLKGEDHKSYQKLQELKEKYPKEYRVYLYLTYLSIKKEEDPQNYYQLALKFYEQAGRPDDSDMIELIAIMKKA